MKKLCFLNKEDSCILIFVDKDLAEKEGFKTSEDGSHLCVEVADPIITVSLRTKDNKTVTLRLDEIGATVVSQVGESLENVFIPWEERE